MALYKTLTISSETKVFIWKIEESIDELKAGITLTTNSEARLNSMKSELHQKGFLSIRHLLKEINLNDADLEYDEFGKPHLKEGYISITHSFNFTAIIYSTNKVVGIDIEKQRDKILKIAQESLYKIYGKKKLLFLHHIYIEDFKFDDSKTTGEIRFNGEQNSYDIEFLEFEGFTCVYAF